MRQSEIKRKYDTELGRDVKKHIYGEGLLDNFDIAERVNQLISAGKIRKMKLT